MLILFTPGAPREESFETMGRVAPGSVLADEDKTAFNTRHDTYRL
jgi:hypothetical protein